jgi:hypothetical protein
MDAKERRKVATMDIPGAFMHTEMKDKVHVKFEGPIATLLTKIDPSFKKFITYERGVPVIYARLKKALYGTLQAALLFWQELSGFLKGLGFEFNPYDECVMNKMIDGSQCTIAWHVDDLKVSHQSQEVIEGIISELEKQYGKEAPLSVTRGPVHEYLGMIIDYSEDGKVKFSMPNYEEEILAECPEELLGRGVTTPASLHLFDTDDEAPKLSEEKSEIFHHLVAKLLYMCKRTRPDLQTAVAFLTTRVKAPDIADWRKLGRCLTYLRDHKGLILTLEADELSNIRWWVDASFAVHGDMKSHTGAAMTLGKGCAICISSKQKINTRSSTEAELVGVNDVLAKIIWIKMFLIGQGYEVTDNVIYQDNMSAMLLERNGMRSSGKNTRHINIRYYFITDYIKRGEVRVEHCPTEEMVADFFTKPLQGGLFKKFRSAIMNIKEGQQLRAQECVGPNGLQAQPVEVEGCPKKATYADVASTPQPMQLHKQHKQHKKKSVALFSLCRLK